MGIDVKESCAIIWKVVGLSMNTSIKFMRNHPILSVVSMLLLALYILLPSLLFFLIYSSPVLACVAVYAREKLGLRFSGSHQPFSSSGPKSCGGEKNGGKCHLRQQRSVRRNARMKVEEWDSQTSEEEKDKVILTSLYNDLLGRTPHFEETPKAIEETNQVAENNDKSFGEEDSPRSSPDLGYLSVDEPMLCNCEINEEKYGGFDGKEEMREEMSNVNEHGILEIERNKRLESLIARRRTRRLFKLALDQRNKLQAEETTSPTQNSNLQIAVPRNNNNNPFEKRRNYPSDSTVMGLQVPGSAPSVMSQTRNPFDIPYDPQEERPNLTGDSFDQEFSFLNHKDMFFCRHESFCRSALFSPEHAQCMNSPVSDISTTRKRLDLDNEYMDHHEQKLPCYVKQATIEDDDKSAEDGNNGDREEEVNNETDSNKEDVDDSSCSEESEPELSRLNKEELREAISHSMDNYPGFLVNQTRNVIPSPLPRGIVPPRLDDNNMYYARRCANSHSRTFSIASDMQVEVSEIGSPPTTVDWLDDWSNGGESNYTYDTDIDREIIRGEESRKRISTQCESRSGTGSNEENNGLGTKPVAKPDQKCLIDEHLRTADDMSFLDRRSQAEENFEQKASSFSDVSQPVSSAKFDGLLFHTSVSLSSITEEPETILDSVDGGNSENMNGLSTNLTDQISLTSLDSSTKNLIDEEVVDVPQLENDDLCGSPKIVNSNIIDHQQKDQILNDNQGEYDTEIHMKEYENTKPMEYEATQSFMDASLETPYIESFEREINEEDEEESNLDNCTNEVTKQTEDPCHVLTKLLESEVMEENGPELFKITDANATPIEQEKTHEVLEASSSHPYTQLVEDYGNAENDSDVRTLHIQDSNNSTFDESTDQEFSKEGENSGLLKDFHAESIQEYNNIVNVEEESIFSEEAHNSQGSQPWTRQPGTKSSEGISPKTLEITQQLEHDDVISQDIVKDNVAAAAKDTTATKKNDEENLKPDEQVIEEAVEKELELNLQSMHHNIGLTASEDDEESKKVTGLVHNAESKPTKTETES